jgi:TonB family protein
MKKRIAVALFVLLSVLSVNTRRAAAQEPTQSSSRKLVTKVLPQYPGLARAANIQGSVRADVLVGPTGRVQSIEVKGGHPVLAQAAQDALKQWKWEPASHETHEIVEMRFKP